MSVQPGSGPGIHRALAPAKVNLGLFLGPTRTSDARHELVSVMQSISLADEITLEDAPPGAERDEVHCPGLDGPGEENLALVALTAFRERTGWAAGPQRLGIVKRIPIAAGLGGGSADAAATLRLARHASGLGDEQLLGRIAAELGADVPAQVAPGRWLAQGAGERLGELPAPGHPLAVLVLPVAAELSTAAVYAEADRLGLGRSDRDLAELASDLRAALEHGAALPAASELLHNDLQRAAVSLCPEIVEALRQLRSTGAQLSMVSGSGPTVVGLFPGAGPAVGSSDEDWGAAGRAAMLLSGRAPAPILASPVGAQYGSPVTLTREQAAADGRHPGA